MNNIAYNPNIPIEETKFSTQIYDGGDCVVTYATPDPELFFSLNPDNSLATLDLRKASAMSNAYNSGDKSMMNLMAHVLILTLKHFQKQNP